MSEPRTTSFVPARPVLFLLIASAFLVAPTGGAARAQDEAPELVTDRPDQTESTAIVPRGMVQLELGTLFTRDDPAEGFRIETLNVLGSLVRIGLLDDRLELRVGWGGWQNLEAEFPTASGSGRAEVDGVTDAELGVKLKLRSENGLSPGIAVIAATSVPVGDDEFTSDEADPSFLLAFSHTLSDRIDLGYNVGMAWATGATDRGRETTLSTVPWAVALGAGVNDRLGVFVELFGEVSGSASIPASTSFDTGITYLLRDNIQLDLSGGVGLSDAADDVFVGVGLSVRLPR